MTNKPKKRVVRELIEKMFVKYVRWLQERELKRHGLEMITGTVSTYQVTKK